MKIVVIVTTYNEKENIVEMLRGILTVIGRQKDTYSILVIDDNSPDGTGEIVSDFIKYNPSVYLLSGKKEGLGVAMRRGYDFVLRKMNADVVVSTEADFAYDPKYIPVAIKKIKEGYDVVVASRHVPEGKTSGWTLNRRINHWVANKFFATWVAGFRKVKDHNGEFRAIRVKGILEKVDWQKVNVKGFGFFNFSLYKLSQATDRFYEFPVTYNFRKKGESKISFNPKYYSSYLLGVIEYIKLCLVIRLESLKLFK